MAIGGSDWQGPPVVRQTAPSIQDHYEIPGKPRNKNEDPAAQWEPASARETTSLTLPMT